MEAIRNSSFYSLHISTSLPQTKFPKPNFLNLQFNTIPTSSFPRVHINQSKSMLFTASAISSPSAISTESIEPELQFGDSDEDKFDWYAHWCPIMLVSELDKRKPHAKKVMGMDIVVWWDRNENAWKVFDDMCPHRLAPLSEGRIDQEGRLQCVYHGWCFNGSGDCKFIPQAPTTNGPPVHTSKKACVGVYPSTVHHGIVWFWPNTDPQYKNVIMKKKPPFIPVIDDASSTFTTFRDVPYGYEVMVENFMDPAHVNYAHYGTYPQPKNKEKGDREGGRPLNMAIKKVDANGFTGKLDGFAGKPDSCEFIAPFIFYTCHDDQLKSVRNPVEEFNVVFICIPVSPGKSRLMLIVSTKLPNWIEKIIPRWIYHTTSHLTFDSDLCLLHWQERKIMEAGARNWHKATFVPTKSDAIAVGFRRWLNKYGGGQVDWRGKYSGALPPSPPREQLMDRYWSHVIDCRSCSAAYKGLEVLQVILQVMSLLSIGIAAVTRQTTVSAAAKTWLVTAAIVCFGAAKWLANFISKNFHYHDYNHAFV